MDERATPGHRSRLCRPVKWTTVDATFLLFIGTFACSYRTARWAPLPITSTWRGKLHCFCKPTLALGGTLATFAPPVFWAWHCASHALASVRSLRPLFAWHLIISLLGPCPLHTKQLVIVDLVKSMWSVTEFRRFTRCFL